MDKQKGIASMAVMLVMLAMAIALPITTKLVQQNQENRSKAYDDVHITADTVINCSRDIDCANNTTKKVCSTSGTTDGKCVFCDPKITTKCTSNNVLMVCNDLGTAFTGNTICGSGCHAPGGTVKDHCNPCVNNTTFPGSECISNQYKDNLGVGKTAVNCKDLNNDPANSAVTFTGAGKDATCEKIGVSNFCCVKTTNIVGSLYARKKDHSCNTGTGLHSCESILLSQTNPSYAVNPSRLVEGNTNYYFTTNPLCTGSATDSDCIMDIVYSITASCDPNTNKFHCSSTFVGSTNTNTKYYLKQANCNAAAGSCSPVCTGVPTGTVIKKCVENLLYTCTGSVASTPVNCAKSNWGTNGFCDGSNQSNNVCKCKNDDTECRTTSVSVLYTCENGSWNGGKECSNGCTADGKTCVVGVGQTYFVYDPADQKCKETKSKYNSKETCNADAANYGACFDNKLECEASDDKCTNAKTGAICQVLGSANCTSTNNQMLLFNGLCPGNNTNIGCCVSTDVCKSATTSVKKCDGNFLFTCENNKPSSPEFCVNGCDSTNNVCNSATSTCSATNCGECNTSECNNQNGKCAIHSFSSKCVCTRKIEGDADCDDDVDFPDDLSIWINEFTRKSTTKKADFNGDDRVDIDDYYPWHATMIK